MGSSGRSPMPPRTAIVPADLEGPVDRAVRALFGASWGKARAWVEGGKVRVGGAVVTEATARVTKGAEIVLDPAAPRHRPGEILDADVTYADAQVVVVAKPAGLSTVPYDESDTDTLDARVRTWLQRRRLSPRGGRPTLGVVHRLDKETTGLVVSDSFGLPNRNFYITLVLSRGRWLVSNMEPVEVPCQP